MTCLQYLISLHKLCCFQTKEGEKYGPASNSELRRWFGQKAVRINHEYPKAEDELPAYVADLVLFPRNPSKRTTLMHEPLLQLTQEP